MNAQKYLDIFKPTCTFYDAVNEGEKRCGAPAVGVYVTADHRHEARYVCAKHADDGERGGDGPVFRVP